MAWQWCNGEQAGRQLLGNLTNNGHNVVSAACMNGNFASFFVGTILLGFVKQL